MTIELDSTLAQAEVLFLSFAQLVADVDRRHAENVKGGDKSSGLSARRRNGAGEHDAPGLGLSSNLRDLLKAGR